MSLLYDIFDANPNSGDLLGPFDSGIPLSAAPDPSDWRVQIAVNVNGDGHTLYGWGGEWRDSPPQGWAETDRRRSDRIAAVQDQHILRSAEVIVTDLDRGDARLVRIGGAAGTLQWLRRADCLGAAEQADKDGARLYQAIARACDWEG